LQRFFVLIVGVVAVYIAVWQIFPLFDHRVPFAIALFFTYVVMAYLVLPAGMRLLRLFYRPSHIPLYCVTPDGLASDPINLGLIGSRTEIIEAMERAGWHLADPLTPRTFVKEVFAVLLRRSYPNAPFNTLYLFGKKPDLGFEKEIDDRPSQRHHVRFWACNLSGPEEFHGDVRFWRRVHRPSAAMPGRQFWVGAASRDIGIAPIRHNAQFSHRVAPDTNAERELIAHNLEKTGLVSTTRSVTIGRPFVLRNRVARSFLRTDGKLTICELKPHS